VTAGGGGCVMGKLARIVFVSAGPSSFHSAANLFNRCSERDSVNRASESTSACSLVS
jgi:hypothetical protein